MGKSNSSNLIRNYKHFFVALLVFILIPLLWTVNQFWTFGGITLKYGRVSLENVRNLPIVIVPNDQEAAKPRNVQCSYWDCFDVYRCGHTGHDRISVYVYPPKKFVDADGVPVTEVISKEFYMVLQTIIESKYYTVNPEEACIFIPPIDTLNQDRLELNLTSKALESLNYWDDGTNHLIFNMVSGTSPNYQSVIEVNIANALVAGADFDIYTFRAGFDISIPIFSPYLHLAEIPINGKDDFRYVLATSSQLDIDSYFLNELQRLQLLHADLLILDRCSEHNYNKRCEVDTLKQFNYPKILGHSKFCLIFRGERMGQLALLEAMASGCIPVVVMDGVVMPFSNVIDWNRAAIFVMEDFLSTVMDVLEKVSDNRIEEMQSQVRFLYEEYFSSIGAIVRTTLDIIQDRVYPQWGRTYDDWNIPPESRLKNPLFIPVTAPKNEGFTAVILTYDRIQSLFLLIEKLSKVPSLMKVVVVWNNQRKSPPPVSNFPKINKPIKVIRTKANKLSNRFYPYEEIQTEAILSIDDDIVMLTADELEFGYEVWREFSDRIVGFPSRTHIWDNVTLTWKYESEWTNEISMVLTGAAFFHKYWNYLYITKMPPEIKDWVDEHMNCEDIAMNFLVANITNKPPIKVAPRKKFKCPECVNNEMLSADLSHMTERSQCVDRFAKVLGRMPLKTVEFRADPVLYKDPFPEKLKRFNDIGSL